MVVNLATIDKAFSVGEKVTAQAIVTKGLVQMTNSATIKVLGGGELTKRLSFSGLAISHKAVDKITKAGGTVS